MEEGFTSREIKTFMEENRQAHDDMKKVLSELVVELNGIQKWRERINGGLYVVGFLGITGILGLIMWWIKLFV